MVKPSHIERYHRSFSVVSDLMAEVAYFVMEQVWPRA